MWTATFLIIIVPCMVAGPACIRYAFTRELPGSLNWLLDKIKRKKPLGYYINN